MAFRPPFFVSTSRHRGTFPATPEMHENGHEPKRDAEMEAHLVKLEQFADKTSDRLTEFGRGLAVIESNYATRADLADVKTSIIVWVVSAVFLTQWLPILLKRLGAG